MIGAEKTALDRDEAIDLIQARLDGLGFGPGNLVILIEHTIERPWGWVFFYEHRLAAAGLRYALGGNAPYFVNRVDGSIWESGTARPIDHYIDEYEQILRFGEPPRILATGLRPGLSLRETLALFERTLGLPRLEAKLLLDRLRAGEETALEPESLSAAQELSGSLELVERSRGDNGWG